MLGRKTCHHVMSHLNKRLAFYMMVKVDVVKFIYLHKYKPAVNFKSILFKQY